MFLGEFDEGIDLCPGRAGGNGLARPGNAVANAVGEIADVECRAGVEANDLARCAQHNEELFDDILATDFYPREFTERMVPPGWIVAVVAVEQVYDQTPGPGAGAPVATT